MTRRYATTEPQHTLPAQATRAFGTNPWHSDNSKPATREAPPSA